MSIGSSGRVVVDIEPGLKKELHSVLTRKGMSLKAWFMVCANELIESEVQTRLPLIDQAETGSSTSTEPRP